MWSRAKKQAYAKEYQRLNAKRLAPIRHAYYVENKDKAREAARRWRRLNPERARALTLKWYHKHIEARRAYGRTYYHKNKHRVNRMALKVSRRRTWLKTHYGLTVDQYDAMLSRQGKACAICRKRHRAKPMVDHDHRTGTVRGLLCFRCNTCLGVYENYKSVFEVYLNKPRGTHGPSTKRSGVGRGGSSPRRLRGRPDGNGRTSREVGGRNNPEKP